ncbi:hypothetical protein L596_024421 [Steinernema carpocapsae]|uniref:BZIP domain-containing protein n=1 Tax=Steinernema carpocapsae TaxID=34508 RepID=A0A4U5MGZ5_STECR|nr:hypothetical protein L596_024421 [Steinernema carpocapsae]
MPPKASSSPRSQLFYRPPRTICHFATSGIRIRDVSILNEFFDGFGSDQVAFQQPTVISSDPSASSSFDPYSYGSDSQMYTKAESSAAPFSSPSAFPEAPKTERDAFSPSSSSDSSRLQHESPMHYREMRDKNNVASQRSRMKRKMKFEALKGESIVLEKRNAELRQLSDELERQLETYKKMMMTMITNK